MLMGWWFPLCSFEREYSRSTIPSGVAICHSQQGCDFVSLFSDTSQTELRLHYDYRCQNYDYTIYDYTTYFSLGLRSTSAPFSPSVKLHDYTTTLRYYTTITLLHCDTTLQLHYHTSQLHYDDIACILLMGIVLPTQSVIISDTTSLNGVSPVRPPMQFNISLKSQRIACISLNLKITISPELRIENNFIR